MDQRKEKSAVRVLAAASFLNDFGSDIIYPVWPFFVTSVLGANMAVLGFIDGLGDAIVSLSSATSGYASDRLKKRKVFIWLGYLFGGVSRVGYAAASVWQHLVPLRVLDRAGKIRSAPRDAIIADLSTDQDRGRNFGLLRTMDNLGAVGGITVCILFFELGPRLLFLLAALPSVVAVVLVLVFIKDRPQEGSTIFKGLSYKDLSRNFWVYLALSSVFALGSFSYSFLLLYAQYFGIAAPTGPVLYLTFTLVAAAFSIPLGRLSDRVGRKCVLLLSFALWAAVCVGFLVARSLLEILLVFVLYGLHKAGIETIQRAFAAELSPAEFRASTYGGFQLAVGLCALPSSFIAGILWEKVDPLAPLYFSVTLTILSMVLLFFVEEKTGTRPPVARLYQ